MPSDVMPADLQVALAGDLSRLTPEGKLKFYGALCQFTGLNPLSKPFDWITFQGKQVLYANKGCAEQLRKLHGVTVEIVERKVEFGCLVVRVKATSKDGRSDEAIGAVPFNPNAQGEAAANAMMKCETKAKRRVTLSICGLGMLDESEVDSMPRETTNKVVAAMNGEDSAAARAERLNQTLTGGQKADAIEAEVVTHDLDRAPELAQAVKPDGHSVAAVQPSDDGNRSSACSSPDPISPPPTAPPQPVAPPQPEPTTATAAALLSDAEVATLEGVLMEYPDPAKAHKYLVHRGWLKLNQPLNELAKKDFYNITTRKPAFFRMVDQALKEGKL